MTTDEEKIYESENEYHDAISDVRELEKRVDIDTSDKDIVLHEAIEGI